MRKLPRAVAWRHTLDTTEGIKGNRPLVVFTASRRNPFGVPGVDYSASCPVTSTRLYTEAQMQAAYAAGMARAAEIVEGMNDKAGDRASYDNREMYDDEITRMHALRDCAHAIRAEIKGA